MSESVSFRISRTAEDLAQTVAALSQRLVNLEQRLGALELQGASLQAQLRATAAVDPAELAYLDSVDQLLADCRSLLAETELPVPAPAPQELPGHQPPMHGASVPELAIDGLSQPPEPASPTPDPATVQSDQDWDDLEDLEDPDLDAGAQAAQGGESGRPGDESLTLVPG